VRLPRLSLCISLLAVSAAWPQALKEQLHLRVPMRDGVELCTNVFSRASARLPAILVRTPYGKGADLAATYRLFVDNGYAVVVQDVRGRGHSEGAFRRLEQEVADASDTLDWVAAQRWSNGKVGMVGGSYLGIAQWKAAISGNPHLKAISPAVSGSDDYEDRFYSKGGALKLGHRLQWLAQNMRAPGFPRPEFRAFVLHLPIRTSDLASAGQTIDVFQTALNHPAYDSFWESISTRAQLEKVRVPVLAFGGWYDNFAENDLEAFRQLRALGREARIVIGPWAHNMTSPFRGFDYGPASVPAIRRMQLEWFDRWLKLRPSKKPDTPANFFVMGANRWQREQQWPPVEAREVRLYLVSGGKANTVDGDGRLGETRPGSSGPDRFVFDPLKPVPTMGGAVCCDPAIFPWGPMDQRPVEKRRDVLVYTSPILKRDLPVLGPIKAVLYASTTAPDTDFTVKLVDVFPDGRAVNLCDGILRLRYRESLERPRLASPGQVYRITVQAGVTGNVFRKGHRLRVEISSSNFPRFDRNPNTGRPVAGETELRTATQTIYHDADRPSHVILPVIP